MGIGQPMYLMGLDFGASAVKGGVMDCFTVTIFYLQDEREGCCHTLLLDNPERLTL